MLARPPDEARPWRDRAQSRRGRGKGTWGEGGCVEGLVGSVAMLGWSSAAAAHKGTRSDAAAPKKGPWEVPALGRVGGYF